MKFVVEWITTAFSLRVVSHNLVIVPVYLTVYLVVLLSGLFYLPLTVKYF